MNFIYLLFGEEDEIDEREQRNNLNHLLKDSIVGGPSIIFNRDHEAYKTYIPNGDKMCKTIIGYDANALYLWEYLKTCQLENITISKNMIYIN
jgi:hypothetical protein